MAGFDAAAAPPSAVQRSPWHSPVPYLFGGLAAMLGLIAFALLILACSYWKLSGYLDNRGDGERDLEAGEEDGGDGASKPPPPVMEEKFLVIMAGQEKPTFLATPMSSRASSFGSKSTCSTSSTTSTENSTLSEADFEEKNVENGEHVEIGNMETHESAADQVH
ncbi:glutamine dumper 3 [Perilla frutescens var. hirtella]|uniref:Glutamine dumper 3 n=1 Tax=Perilla frutescens var. hirtella TaxID=608512 RepID=A0AAD4PDL2_PERFH|nr:glutamine dumper 3 [Perilla frutescens var. hirtella]KAH6817477.1 glutamine dumper 3 [Perilla frutescens var. frutescens]KAH6835376.1 glutamine dumper 3 [Perilla frutescens var. hirtella]